MNILRRIRIPKMNAARPISRRMSNWFEKNIYIEVHIYLLIFLLNLFFIIYLFIYFLSENNNNKGKCRYERKKCGNF